jgi:hypothetical protein
MKIQVVIITEFGSFNGEILEVSEEQYDNIIEFSKQYYLTGFEMNLENDGGFIIFTPEIIKKSVLKINKL